MFWDCQPLVTLSQNLKLSPAQIEVLHVPDVDILDYMYKF